MINCTLKLKPTARQERQLQRWLWHLTGVYNWAVRKIELDARDKRYHSLFDLMAMLTGHGRKIGIHVQVLQVAAAGAHLAWRDCFTGLRRKPRLKSRRNKLNWMVFRDGKSIRIKGRRIHGLAQTLGSFSFHKQAIPEGKIKRLRIIRRASGWYGVLTIDAEPAPIAAGAGEVGIDPGFKSLLTLSSGEKIDRPMEQARTAVRLAQAQRGGRRRLTARLYERTAFQRKDRNHKLSRRLVSENRLIVRSKDEHAKIARKFGKSVHSSAHHQLREFLRYKSRSGGTQFLEVSPRNSTRTCSACGSLTGPTGLTGLKVRHWVCSTCGVEHDRDGNAAANILNTGRGIRLKNSGDAVSEIANDVSR